MGETSDLLKGRASIQKATGIGWQNFVKFYVNKVLHYRLGTAGWMTRTLGSRWAELSMSPQCSLAAMKGNRRLGCISKSLAHRWRGMILPLHLALVRSCEEYSVHNKPCTTTLLINWIKDIRGPPRWSRAEAHDL